MDTLEINQLVWGKARGHPWWPGIVINIKITLIKGLDYKIEFIGDPTQYRLISDFLRSSSIKPFSNTPENATKVKIKVIPNKRLQTAIAYAEKIHQGLISVNSIENLNQDIENSIKVSKSKVDKKEIHSKQKQNYLKVLKNHLKKCLKFTALPEPCKIFDDISNLLTIISASEETNLNSPTIQESISQLLLQFPNIPIKICKFMLKLCVNNEAKFGRMASVAEDFQILWRSLKNQEMMKKEMQGIRDMKLRKHICRKFAQKIQELGVDKREAQIKALNIEEVIRQQFPEMKEDYIRKSKLTLRCMKEKIGL